MKNIPMTIDFFLDNIVEEFNDYIVQIKLKYDCEQGYRYTTTLLLYDSELNCFVWNDDFDEGEQEIYISNYINVDDVFYKEEKTMTNFEKITESTQTLAEVLKDCQEIYYCGQCPAYDFCKDTSGIDASECYLIIQKWLEKEVEENEK